jgi:hypothetical protein
MSSARIDMEINGFMEGPLPSSRGRKKSVYSETIPLLQEKRRPRADRQRIRLHGGQMYPLLHTMNVIYPYTEGVVYDIKGLYSGRPYSLPNGKRAGANETVKKNTE